MSHGRLEKKRNLYVIVSTVILLLFWIIWVIATNPYEPTEETQEPGIWDELASSTEDLKIEYNRQKEQINMLHKYIQTQVASTTPTSTPEINDDVILEMKDILEQSTSTEN
ncbi:MAG: hypothetical protein ACPGO5_04760 [Patescibacteria group bacterium]